MISVINHVIKTVKTKFVIVKMVFALKDVFLDSFKINVIKLAQQIVKTICVIDKKVYVLMDVK